MNRGGFSWNRFLGITRAKQRISRATRIPMTRSGRQRKFGATMGCATFILMTLSIFTLIIFAAINIF